MRRCYGRGGRWAPAVTHTPRTPKKSGLMLARAWPPSVTPQRCGWASSTPCGCSATSPGARWAWTGTPRSTAPPRYQLGGLSGGVRVLEVVPTLLCPQGKFQGLDLNEELYLGGYPDIGAVAKTGLSRGFMGEWRVPGGTGARGRQASCDSSAHLHLPAGCVRQLRIQGEEVAFGDMDLQAHGVTNCPTCQDRPCQVRMEGRRWCPPIPAHL